MSSKQIKWPEVGSEPRHICKMKYFVEIINSKLIVYLSYTAQKMKFSIKDFCSKCDQIQRKLRIWSRLLKKSLMENFIFCAVLTIRSQVNFFSQEVPSQMYDMIVICLRQQ